jgi:hypothetical protein
MDGGRRGFFKNGYNPVKAAIPNPPDRAAGGSDWAAVEGRLAARPDSGIFQPPDSPLF